MIVRAENRGLGLQCWELYRHLKPERVIVADLGELSPHDNHLDRYPNRWADRNLSWNNHSEMERFLSGMDVLLTAETPYWYDLLSLAAKMGVKTAIQYNYEFFRWLTDPELARPDLFISPSRWHMDDVPDAVYLPLPVDRQRCQFRSRTQARTFLHIAGHRTRLDRNGTQTVIEAASLVRAPVDIVIKSQSPLGVDPWVGFAGARLRIDVEDSPNYWEMYDEGDVLLLPRRFGGQSLPMAEAMSCGMPLICSDVEPQSGFLPVESLVPARVQQVASLQPGPVEIYETDATAMARRIEQFALDDDLVQRLSTTSDEWAAVHSWEALLPKWRKVLSDLVRS